MKPSILNDLFITVLLHIKRERETTEKENTQFSESTRLMINNIII